MNHSILPILLWEFPPQSICRISDVMILVRISRGQCPYELMDSIRTQHSLTNNDVWENASGIEQKSGLQLLLIYWEETDE